MPVDFFDGHETKYCLERKDSDVHFAARYAAKKAYCRLFHLPLRHMGQISVTRDKTGQVKYLPGKFFKAVIGSAYQDALLSISHTKTAAAAFAVIK